MIKPDKQSFWVMRIFGLAIFMLIPTIISSIFIYFEISSGSETKGLFGFLIFFAFLFIALILTIENAFVYKKEEYYIENKQIITKTGRILSDKNTSLPIKNITFVDLELPFIEHQIFKTGIIRITSAGTGLEQSVIKMTNLKEYQKVYDELISKMKANGFSMQNKELLYKAKPDSIGIILNIIRKTLSGIVSLFTLTAFGGIISYGIFQSPIIPLLLLSLTIIVSIVSVIIRYLDLKKREYLVYEDSVNYKKGFLSKHLAFIPVENLSDSTSSQTLTQRIFGVYDIEISSKGIQTEIIFKNLTEGKALEDSIDGIIRNYQRSDKPVKQELIKNDKKRPVINYEEKEWQPSSFTASLQMNKMSAFIQFFFGFVIGGGILTAIIAGTTILNSENIADGIMLIFITGFTLIFGFFTQVISIFATKYEVAENNIVENYKFFSIRKKEFNIKKITTFSIKRTILDRLFKTCSVKFISIGSGYDITFKNIEYNEEFLKNLKAKFGFDDNETPIEIIKPQFSLTKMFFNSTNSLIFLSIAIIIGVIGLIIFQLLASNGNDISGILPTFSLIVFGYIGLSIFLTIIAAIWNHYYYPRSSLRLFKDKLVFKEGLFDLSESYARYENIKDLVGLKMPVLNCGTLTINIAGDQLMQQQNQYSQYSQNSNNVQNNRNQRIRAGGNVLNVRYIDNPHDIVDLLEEFMQYKIDPKNYDRSKVLEKFKSENLLITKSSFANELVTLLIVSLFLWVLVIAIPIKILELNKRRYLIQGHRVLALQGIIYRSKTSILYSKIDNINIQQGAFNKIFKNSTITLETAGSLMPEMFLQNIKDANNIQEIIKQKIEIY